MATGDERTYFEDKRELPQQRIKDTFFDYLEARLREVSSRVWGSQRGVFGSCSLIASGNNEFDVSILPKDFLDGNGNILTLAGTDAEDIVFANENAIDYYVAVKHCKIPKGVLRNPRNQVIFYDTEEDRIGEVDEPDSLSEVGGGLKIIIDSVFEATQRNDGRLATVWLRRAVTIDESVAIERNVAVQWDGSNNYIQTTGVLGQGVGSASTNVADYQVAAQGVTVRKNTNLSITDPYAYIGGVTGGGWGNPPSAFSVIGQIDVSDGINPDLQEAYLNGRTITPSVSGGGAVRIQSLDSSDSMKSLLVLDRKGATESSPIGLATINERDTGIPFIVLNPMIETGGALQEDESGTSAAGAGVVNLTRGGVDLTVSEINIYNDLVILSGFTTPGMNRIYKMSSYTATQITVVDLDGTAPSPWNGSESGNVSIMRSQVVLGDENSANGMFGLARPMTLAGGNNLFASPVLRIYPMNSEAAFEIMSKDTSSIVTRSERNGRIANPHVFEDDFHYNNFQWPAVPGTINIANFPKEYTFAVSSTGSSEQLGIVPPATTILGWGGVVLLSPPQTVTGQISLNGPVTFSMHPNIMKLRFMTRYAIGSVTDRMDFVGVSDPGNWNNARIGFLLDQLTAPNSWYFNVTDGTNIKLVSLSLPNESINTYRNMYFSVIDYKTVEVFTQGMSAPVTIDITPVDLTVISKTLGTGLTALIEIDNTVSALGYLDYWWVSSEEAISKNRPPTPI